MEIRVWTTYSNITQLTSSQIDTAMCLPLLIKLTGGIIGHLIVRFVV
jgi:hypothetical protein